MYEIAIWKMWQLVHMAEQAPIADSTIRYQERLIQKNILYNNSADSVTEIRTQELNSERRRTDDMTGAYQVQVRLTEVETQIKHKWQKISVIAIIVAIAELALIIL